MSELKSRLRVITAMAGAAKLQETEKYLPAILAKAQITMEDAAEAGLNHVILSAVYAGNVPKDLRVGLCKLIIQHYGNEGFDCRPCGSDGDRVKVGWE